MTLSFDATFYQTHRPDVYNAFIATAGSTGLTWAEFAAQHYDTFGRFEGSDPSASFDTSFYLSTYPDVAAAGVNPFDHFLNLGSLEDRQPVSGFPNSSNGFDAAAYKAANSDLASMSDAEAYQHFVIHGQFESRPGTPTVDDPGSTTSFTLTTGTDTATSNVFEAPLETLSGLQGALTLQSADTLTGTGDNPTLNATVTAAVGPIAATLNGIQTANFTALNLAGAVTFDARNATSLTAINSVNSNQTLTVQNIAYADGLAVGANDTTGASIFTLENDTISGDSDAVGLNLNKQGGAVTINDDGSNAIEVINIVSSGGGTAIADTANNGGLTLGAATVNVSGTGALAAGAVGTGVTTFDASALEADLTVTLGATNVTATGGTMVDNFNIIGTGVATVSGGTGDDIVNMNGVLGATDVLDGGDGTDTLISDIGTPATAVDAKNFETVQLGQSGLGAVAFTGGATFDVSKLTGSTISRVVVKDNAGTATINELASGSTVVINGEDGETTNQDENDVTIGILDADEATSLSDVANVEIGRVADGANAGTGNLTVGIRIDDVETVNILSSGTSALNTIDQFIVNTANTINITGDDDLTMQNPTAGALDKVDASAFTGDLIIDAGAGDGTAAAGSTITGVEVLGGSGDDQLTTGGNIDKLVGGAGSNVFDGNAGNDLIDMTSGSKDRSIYEIGADGSDAYTGFTTGTSQDVLDIVTAGAPNQLVTDNGTVIASGVSGTNDLVAANYLAVDNVDFAAATGFSNATQVIFEIESSVATLANLDVTAFRASFGNGGANEIQWGAANDVGEGLVVVYTGTGSEADAAVFYVDVSTNAGGDTAIEATDTVTLVGTFEDVGGNSFVSGNFL